MSHLRKISVLVSLQIGLVAFSLVALGGSDPAWTAQYGSPVLAAILGIFG